jgi:cell division protein FtsZ
MFNISESLANEADIRVIGVGGGGCNAVKHMSSQDTPGVHYIFANTDAQILAKLADSESTIQLGTQLTKGLGAGANPEIGKRAAQEDRARIQEALEGADMVFITAGMGGGTGTGAAPIVAEVAKDMGILTVGVVTRPFPFEGRRRMQVAEAGIAELKKHVDSLIIIPNEKLLHVLGKNISLLDAFKACNNVLQGAVQGISELITRPGLINVDFADVRTVMSEMGMAMMGTAKASGDNRAVEAAEAAVSSPLLEDISLSGAKGVLVNITGGMDMSIGEFEEVGEVIKSFTSDQATVVVGTVIDPELKDELRVTIVVTGLESGDTEMSTTRSGERVYTYGANAGTRASHAPVRGAGRTGSVATHGNAAPTTQASKSGQVETDAASAADPDYLDIPTFLRRQAD